LEWVILSLFSLKYFYIVFDSCLCIPKQTCGCLQQLNNSLNLLYTYIYIYICLFIYSFIHICMHSLGHFSTQDTHLPSPCLPLASRQNLFFPFLQFFWREDISDNKKDIAFLLVEKRISIQRDSYHCFHTQCITTWIDSSLPDLFTTSQSPYHIDLCHF
jgi:hypothetical protein